MSVKDRVGFSLSGPAIQNRNRNIETQIKEAPEELDFIDGIDSSGRILGGTKRKKSEPPPVIPLDEGWVGKYKDFAYQKLARGELDQEEAEETKPPESTDQEAPAEPHTIDDTSYEYIMSLPPLLRNRPPGLNKISDERDKFLYDVACRPDTDVDSYERIPLEKFGEAMLRGMGWAEGVPIGKNSTHVQKVIQLIKQPERLGLGASVQVQPKQRPEGWIPKPGESRKPPPVMALPKGKDGKVRHWKTIDEKLKPLKEPFSVGSRVYIHSGDHSGLTATVTYKQDPNVIVVLPSDERVIVRIAYLQELGEDEEPPMDKTKNLKKKSRETSSQPSPKKMKSSPKPQSSTSTTSNTTSSTTSRWITPDISVKICSKSVEGGKYYCKKGWIIDVLPEGRCVVKVDGSILDGIEERDLETVVPGVSAPVKVVYGEFKGETGKVLEKDSKKGIVYVRLDDDFEVHKMSFDDVAEYLRE